MTGDSQKTAWLMTEGSPDGELARTLEQRVEQRIAGGRYTRDDAQYIAKMHLRLCSGLLDVSDETLEKLRRLCQLWDVDVRIRRISSHRRVIGPVIVAAKRLLYPMLRVLLKDFIRQQRSFNAAAIAAIADLHSAKRPVR